MVKITKLFLSNKMMVKVMYNDQLVYKVSNTLHLLTKVTLPAICV